MKNIVLLGFMGTGKSAVGRALAKELKYRFVDTDQRVEEKSGKKIAELFTENGEAYFRELESQAVQEAAQQGACVISTGGGAILNPKNLEALRRNGFLVLLESDPEVILKRVQKRAGQRPLLQGPDPLAEIKRLLEERAPYYRCADFTVNTSYLQVEEVTRAIKKKVLEIEGRENTR